VNDVATALGIAICEAWGLNASDVFAIDVHWRPLELPRATVSIRTTEGVIRELLTLSVVDRRIVEDES
jgi:hypothetical protein